MFLLCYCSFKNNKLEIISGNGFFSGFSITITIKDSQVKAKYSEYNSDEATLKAKLRSKKKDEIVVPATIHEISLNKEPQNGIDEIYGKVQVTSAPYFTYSNAWGFKNGYIKQAMSFTYYFKCDLSKK